MLVNLHTVDVRRWTENPDNLYIGRQTPLLQGSKWGNPYKIHEVDCRKEAVELYEQYVRKNSVLLKDLQQLRGKNLGCWCHPEPCHGEVLQRLLQESAAISDPEQQRITYENPTMTSVETVARPESVTPTKLKHFTIKDIGSITIEELATLFGLNSNEPANTTPQIQISSDENGNHASIAVPETSQELAQLRNVNFKGRDLVVTCDDEAMESGNDTNDSNTTANEDEGEVIFMILDVRNHPDLNFPPVSETEVCDALLKKHPGDYHLAVKAGWASRLGTFAIESQDIDSYLGSTLNIRGHDIPLRPIRRKSSQQFEQQKQHRQDDYDPDAIKVRIFDAFQMRYRSIESELFDKVFLDMGVDVIKPTLPERCRERKVFNFNRYVIIKPYDENGDKVDLGERIRVNGRSFKISYPGKLHFCSLCQTKHGKECARRIRFEALRKLRKGKTNEAKIYSDSTLRLTNQLALTTNVACMSGGGIGQICNLIPLDSHQHKEVVINAGTNELKTESVKEFVFEVETAALKLK